MNPKRLNLGSLLSLIAFLIAILPATYNLVDSFRTFVAVLQDAQKKLVILQEEQGKILKTIAQKQDSTQSSEMLERLDRIETMQLDFQERLNDQSSNPTTESGDNKEDAGDGEQKSDAWTMEPPPAESDCSNEMCPKTESQPTKQNYRRRFF